MLQIMRPTASIIGDTRSPVRIITFQVFRTNITFILRKYEEIAMQKKRINHTISTTSYIVMILYAIMTCIIT